MAKWSATALIVATALAGLPAGERRPMPATPVLRVAPLPLKPQWPDFGGERPTRPVRELARWIVTTADHQRHPFAIIDKHQARLLVFDAQARLLGATPVLLGSARGDHSVPGIGTRPIDHILPAERTTPAGRFEAMHGRNLEGEDVIWVDYEAAVSMHRVRPRVAAERRLQRLASPTALDNRISYGCINVPARFFDQVLKPAFSGPRFIVYVLPETRSWRAVFAADASARRTDTGHDSQPD